MKVMIYFKVIQAKLLILIQLPSDVVYTFHIDRKCKHTFLISKFEQDKGHISFQRLYNCK